MDIICTGASNVIKEEIITPGNIIYYQAAPGVYFGMAQSKYFETRGGDLSNTTRYFTRKSKTSGFYTVYKVFAWI